MTLLTTLQNDSLNAAIFTLALVIALAALFVCGFVLWAARGRQDPADVDVTSRLGPYTDSGGHVDVGEPQLRVVQDGEAS